MAKYKLRRYNTTTPMMASGMALIAAVSVPTSPTPAAVIEPELPEVIVVYDQPMTTDLAPLKNKRVGGLWKDYLGQTKPGPVVLPATADIDYGASLEAMWTKKLNRSSVSGATLKNGMKIVDRYRLGDPGLTNTDGFIAQSQGAINAGYNAIDWDGYCNYKRLREHQCEALQAVAGKLRGKNLIAYGMTELFPGMDGNFNKAALDTILQHGGAEYIQSIPAMYDQYLSFGFYQFTSFAIRHDTTVEGASQVGLFSDKKLPGSVLNLKGETHHLAAYYFAIHNLATLAKRLDTADADRLTKCPMLGVTQFIATAHHLPAPSVRAAKRWVGHCNTKPYTEYVSGSLKTYALKTKANLMVYN